MTQNGLNRWIQEWYEQNETDLRAYMHDVWSHPEVGLNNEHAARVSWQFAKTHGFPDAKLVRAGEGLKETEHPNAVVAEYGTGSPKVAIVGELDALPGLGNENVPYRAEIKGPGHGCGHNLIAGSCMGAACALRYAMEKEGVKGTLRMVEAPGEEVGRGKAKLAEDGVFSDLDLAMMWHPGPDEFTTEPQYAMVMNAGTFDFYGKTSHAYANPWDGRSALDAVQLMNMGCEFLREHVTKDCFFHYQILDGGQAPSIVPDHASVKYFCRSASVDGAADLYRRVMKCAEGAATMTETEVKRTDLFIIPYFFINKPLCAHMNAVARKVPEVEYTNEEIQFARELTKNLTGKDIEDVRELLPFQKEEYDPDPTHHVKTATDMADVSYYCPTVHIHGGGCVRKAHAHHWAITVCAGSTIGEKYAERAGKVLAEGALEAFQDPEVVKQCWEAFKEQNIPTHEELYKDLHFED